MGTIQQRSEGKALRQAIRKMGALSLLCKSETTVGASTREPGEGAWQEQHRLRRGLLDGILSKNETDTERGGVGSGGTMPKDR